MSSSTSSESTGKEINDESPYIFRDNRFLGFLYRSPDHILVALPMVLFFAYIAGRFVRSQPLATLTFGILGEKGSD